MLSNLYRLSRSLRSLIAVTIYETLPHTHLRNALRYSQRTSISVSSVGIESFSTLKELEKYRKSRKPTSRRLIAAVKVRRGASIEISLRQLTIVEDE